MGTLLLFFNLKRDNFPLQRVKDAFLEETQART